MHPDLLDKERVPAEHFIHFSDLIEEKVPSGHAEQSLEPSFEKYPAEQSIHFDLSLEFFVPAGHLIHSLEPSPE